MTRPGGSTQDVADAGPVRFSKPAGRAAAGGPLVYLPAGQEITADNAKGKVVVRDFKLGSLPFGALQALVSLYTTPDLAGDKEYARPYIDTNESDLLAAGRAGARGVVLAFDLPRKQVRGYYDPHSGTIQRIPAVFVGRAEGERLKALATEGASAKLSVNARIDRTTTRNVVARLPGRSKEKIVLAANTDGSSYVQENGVIGMLALARYYADLPLRCRPRTLELVFGSSHDTTTNEGTERHVEQLNRNRVAFGFAIEHLGTREILPTGTGADRRLKFTGKGGDPFLFATGDSKALRRTAIAKTKSRKLDRTGVLRGLGIPDESVIPSICSMGGIGTYFHERLIPTLTMISGPWSLYDPVFGRRALDFARMRRQLLAAGDAILALDGLSRRRIAGDYLDFRRREAQGAKVCDPNPDPQFAPGPS